MSQKFLKSALCECGDKYRKTTYRDNEKKLVSCWKCQNCKDIRQMKPLNGTRQYLKLSMCICGGKLFKSCSAGKYCVRCEKCGANDTPNKNVAAKTLAAPIFPSGYCPPLYGKTPVPIVEVARWLNGQRGRPTNYPDYLIDGLVEDIKYYRRHNGQK